MSERMTFYVVDATGLVVNAVETDSRERAQRVADSMIGGPYTVDPAPPERALTSYRYWSERP